MFCQRQRLQEERKNRRTGPGQLPGKDEPSGPVLNGGAGRAWARARAQVGLSSCWGEHPCPAPPRPRALAPGGRAVRGPGCWGRGRTGPRGPGGDQPRATRGWQRAGQREERAEPRSRHLSAASHLLKAPRAQLYSSKPGTCTGHWYTLQFPGCVHSCSCGTKVPVSPNGHVDSITYLTTQPLTGCEKLTEGWDSIAWAASPGPTPHLVQGQAPLNSAWLSCCLSCNQERQPLPQPWPCLHLASRKPVRCVLLETSNGSRCSKCVF